MPTVLTHAVAAAAIAPAVLPTLDRRTTVAATLVGALLAMAPDVDVLAFRLGIPYGHMLGHRGLSHSLTVAAVMAVVVGAIVGRRLPARARPGVTLYLFLATASHGLLDTLTDGGRGIALLAPWSGERYFAPWQPIAVSPIGLRRFLSARGAEVLASEAMWVWLPATGLGATIWWLRRRRSRSATATPA